MKIFKITIAYVGTKYHGWQIQKNANTVEGELVRACHKLFSQVVIRGASRTDTGVHALCQVVTIKADTKMTCERLVYALNAHLPKDIVVQNSEEVSENFHPRFHAIRKTYGYKIYNAKVPLPQYNETAYYYHKILDTKKMQQATKYFIGKHDFFAFSSDGGNVKTTVRTIFDLQVNKEGNLIEILVTGDGFLYNMVRIIVGTLIDIGLHRKKPEDIPSIIASMDRRQSGKKAPALGLTLMHIEY